MSWQRGPEAVPHTRNVTALDDFLQQGEQTMLRRIGAALLTGAILAAAPAQAQEEINFGIISTESSTNLKKIWDPFLADMQKGTDLKINAFFASDYAGVIEGMRFKKVQLAWFGNKSAMEAVDRASGEIFAQSVDKDGNPGYWSHLIVHKDSPFQSLDDVLKCDATLDFGIGDPNSTSGFLVPTTFIFSARNIDPKKCFKTVRNANHEANALAVANKLVHVATNNNENLQRLAKTAPDKVKEVRIIWTSPLIPSDPLVWRKDLDAGLKQKIADFIFSYGTADEAEKKILAGLQWAPFKKSDNNQLLPIRQMEVNKALAKLKADASIAEADKQAQVAELQKEFDELGRKIAALK
jgi:phosphonate transport system substrate-binding protein